jgi:alkylation response protein AidB-like acyl-CoA dehydrogenase
VSVSRLPELALPEEIVSKMSRFFAVLLTVLSASPLSHAQTYPRERKQFGQFIGEFQLVQARHR